MYADLHNVAVLRLSEQSHKKTIHSTDKKFANYILKDNLTKTQHWEGQLFQLYTERQNNKNGQVKHLMATRNVCVSIQVAPNEQNYHCPRQISSASLRQPAVFLTDGIPPRNGTPICPGGHNKALNNKAGEGNVCSLVVAVKCEHSPLGLAPTLFSRESVFPLCPDYNR